MSDAINLSILYNLKAIRTLIGRQGCLDADAMLDEKYEKCSGVCPFSVILYDGRYECLGRITDNCIDSMELE